MAHEIDAVIGKARPKIAELISRHKRHSDMALYTVLADCLRICELCLAHPKELKHLGDLIRELPRGNAKRSPYMNRSSDAYQLVARYMFHGEEHHANMNRYAICMREAARIGVTSHDLADWLRDNGGVSKLFLSRAGQSPTVSTRCIRLDRPVTHPKDKIIVLRLRRRDDNVYEVLDTPYGT